MFLLWEGREVFGANFFENVFTSLDREGGVSFQIIGTSVVASAKTCDVTGCVVAGSGILRRHLV